MTDTNENVEMVDVYDANMNHIPPFSVSKTTVHKEGLWHKSVHCWIIKDNNKILFQLRPPKHTSKNFVSDGLLDVTSSGHLMSGETEKDGIREIKEELGLDVDFNDLTFLGIYKQCVIRNIGDKDYRNQEFSYTYFYKSNKNVDEYTLQAEELTGLFEMDIDEGLQLFSFKKDEITVDGVVLSPSGLKKEKRNITIKDMAGSHERCIISRYYLKVLIMAKRFINNEEYLAI